MTAKEDYDRRKAEHRAKDEKGRSERWHVKLIDPITIFTGMLAIVAIFQLRAMLSTDEATHDLAKAAIDQAQAAKDAADGIKGQVATMQSQLAEMQRQSEFTIAQLRPKLTVEFKGPNQPMKLGGKEGWVLTPVWENHGGSEGIEWWGWVGAKLFTPDAPPDFDFLTFIDDPHVPIPRTTIGISGFRLQASRIITKEEVQSVMDGKGKFIIWGYVEYKESLPGNRPHYIHYCYETVPVDAGNTYIFSYPLYRPECNTSD